MSETTKIAWTDATWNPVRGCTRVSEGCRHCYAERVAARFSGPGMPYDGLAKQTKDGPRWTGKVRVVEKHLEDPLRWKKPRRVFVNSMSDLFHESISDATIARVFAVMALAERHTFQVLTKRPARMRALLSEHRTKGDHPGNVAFLHQVGRLCEEYATHVEKQSAGAMMGFDAWWGLVVERGWFQNIWHGVSVEDQPTADERISLLLETPAAVRFVSAEPMLGPIDFRKVPGFNRVGLSLRNWWVILGGESGPGARPCRLEWIEALVAQCKGVGVPVFVKQLGARPIENDYNEPEDPRPVELQDESGDTYRRLSLRHPKGADPAEWPEYLRVQEWPEPVKAGV